MGNNLLFTMKCLFPLFMGGLAVLNSCKEDHPVINDDSGQGSDVDDEYVYIDDRYDNGISCEEYLANYRGVPFKKGPEGNSLFVISEVPTTIEAEDFDDGGQNISFHFKKLRLETTKITVKKRKLPLAKAERS